MGLTRLHDGREGQVENTSPSRRIRMERTADCVGPSPRADHVQRRGSLAEVARASRRADENESGGGGGGCDSNDPPSNASARRRLMRHMPLRGRLKTPPARIRYEASGRSSPNRILRRRVRAQGHMPSSTTPRPSVILDKGPRSNPPKRGVEKRSKREEDPGDDRESSLPLGLGICPAGELHAPDFSLLMERLEINM